MKLLTNDLINNGGRCIPCITVIGDVVVTGPLSGTADGSPSDVNCPYREPLVRIYINIHIYINIYIIRQGVLEKGSKNFSGVCVLES